MGERNANPSPLQGRGWPSTARSGVGDAADGGSPEILPAGLPHPPAPSPGGEGEQAVARLAPEDDPRALIPHLARLTLIEIAFPTFRDGRGYSFARILREAGYAGELRATGDVLVDQIAPMRRVGFDSFRPDRPLDPAAVERALARYDYAYQRAADGRTPVWALRHG